VNKVPVICVFFLLAGQVNANGNSDQNTINEKSHVFKDATDLTFNGTRLLSPSLPFNTLHSIVPGCSLTWILGRPTGETTPTKTVNNVDCETCVTECGSDVPT